MLDNKTQERAVDLECIHQLVNYGFLRKNSLIDLKKYICLDMNKDNKTKE